jgi:hypothetical protein
VYDTLQVHVEIPPGETYFLICSLHRSRIESSIAFLLQHKSLNNLCKKGKKVCHFQSKEEGNVHIALRALVHSFMFQCVERSAPHGVTCNYLGTCNICEVLNKSFVSFFYTKFVLNISRPGKYMRVHLEIQVTTHAGQYDKTSLKPSDSNKSFVSIMFVPCIA